VARIEALHALHGPTALERRMPRALREESALGLARWELVALPLLLALAGLAGVVALRLFAWAARRSPGYWRTLALNALRWPSVILIVSTVLLIATQNLLVFSGPISAVFGPLIVIGYVIAFLLFGLQVIDTAMAQFVTFDMGELAAHDKDDTRNVATAMSAARRVLVIVAVVVSFGYIVSAAQVTSMLGLSLLASAGALTLILGFAARRVLGNIMASLQIMLNRSARIGDQILFEGHWCTVERIHFTFVQLKVWNGDRFVVPVERFVSEDFLSYTLMETEQVRTICITLDHRADMDAVRKVFADRVGDQEGVTDAENAHMRVIEHDGFGPVARFQFPVANPDDGWIAECELRERLIAGLQELERDSERPVLPRQSLDLGKD
jgi:small-conductance mechanosensitive channel